MYVNHVSCCWRYLPILQLCGVRGGGNAAAQALFWQANKGLSFVLAFESEREKGMRLILARRFADCNVGLQYRSIYFYIWQSRSTYFYLKVKNILIFQSVLVFLFSSLFWVVFYLSQLRCLLSPMLMHIMLVAINFSKKKIYIMLVGLDDL